MSGSIVKVGEYTQRFNDLLNVDLEVFDIMMSSGLRTHMERRGHTDCLTYLNQIEEIIRNPTYIGINPNESDPSFELIKDFGDNVLVGIKLDMNNSYYYVSTMHKIQPAKISRRLNSGRIKLV